MIHGTGSLLHDTCAFEYINLYRSFMTPKVKNTKLVCIHLFGFVMACKGCPGVSLSQHSGTLVVLYIKFFRFIWQQIVFRMDQRFQRTVPGRNIAITCDVILSVFKHFRWKQSNFFKPIKRLPFPEQTNNGEGWGPIHINVSFLDERYGKSRTSWYL